jgi:hypothetical protein
MTIAFPFLAAIVMLIASPWLIRRAKNQVELWMARAAKGPVPVGQNVPDYLAPAQILTYVEYAADIGQIVPTIALTGVGVIAALPPSTPPTTAAGLTLGIVVVLVVVDAALLGVSPQRYVRRKIAWMSAVPFAGVVVNLVALGAMLLINR